MSYTKLPNLFQTNEIVINGGKHTQGWNKMSASVAIDFGYTGDLICPFNGCEVKTYPGSDAGTQSYFSITLPDGSEIICVHGYPVRTGKFNKGEVIGKCRHHHWHLSMIVDGKLDCILKYLDRGLNMYSNPDASLYGTRDHADGKWSTYEDKTLLLPDSAIPQQPQPQPQPQPAPAPVNPLDQIKRFGWEIVAQIKAAHPDFYNNWPRADGNINNMPNENPYVWVKELCDQIGWKIEALIKQITEKDDKIKELTTANKNLTDGIAGLEVDKNDLETKNDGLKLKIDENNAIYIARIDELNAKIKQLENNKSPYLSRKFLVELTSTATAIYAAVLPYLQGLELKWDPNLNTQENLAKIAGQVLLSVLSYRAVKTASNQYIKTQGNIDLAEKTQTQRRQIEVTGE